MLFLPSLRVREPVCFPQFEDPGARHRLAQVIIAAFQQGERDPEVLKRMALEIGTPTYRPSPDIE